MLPPYRIHSATDRLAAGPGTHPGVFMKACDNVYSFTKGCYLHRADFTDHTRRLRGVHRLNNNYGNAESICCALVIVQKPSACLHILLQNSLGDGFSGSRRPELPSLTRQTAR